MPAISLPSNVIGSEIETGSAVSGASGLLFDVVELVARGVDVALLVACDVFKTFDVEVEDPAAGVAAGVVVATFGVTAVTVDVPGVGVTTFGEEDEAPAGTNPTNNAAARATPLPTAPSVVRRFRLKALLLLFFGV
jgi:hypothetical protein